MSPLTLEKIKKAGGNVKISEERVGNTSVDVMEYHIKVKEGDAWVTVYKSRERSICEQAIRGVNSKLILG